MRLSVEVGRLPSVLGREFFRARVSSYHVSTFEDTVIFVHDMETGAIVDVNPKATASWGYTREEFRTLEIGALGSGVPPYTYSWAPPSGLDNPAVPNPVATSAVDVTYIVTVTDSLGQQATDACAIACTSIACTELLETGPTRS